MDRNDSALKRYIRGISDGLPYSMRARKQILSQIRESIDDYLRENPEADLATVQAHFGTPQEIAASFVNEQDASTLLHKMSIKKKVLVMVAGVMAMVLLTWAGVVVWATMDASDSTKGNIGVSAEMNYFTSNDIGG